MVTEAGDEVEPSAERFDVTGYRVDGGQLAPLDLGNPPRGDAHGLGELGLSEAVALAFSSEPLTAVAARRAPADRLRMPRSEQLHSGAETTSGTNRVEPLCP